MITFIKVLLHSARVEKDNNSELRDYEKKEMKRGKSWTLLLSDGVEVLTRWWLVTSTTDGYCRSRIFFWFRLVRLPRILQNLYKRVTPTFTPPLLHTMVVWSAMTFRIL